MNDIKTISTNFLELWGYNPLNITRMPQSGSDRRYYRVDCMEDTVIGVINSDRDENRAFTGFTRHFLEKGLPVPELKYYREDDEIMFVGDLGNSTLLDHLHSLPEDGRWNTEVVDLFKTILDYLILFQTEAVKGLDLSLCYPHQKFDSQSMMWDLNYFKYMFLRLARIPFSEKRLEKDFLELSAFLCDAQSDYFLYRDFQSANIMIMEGNPFFIDYQGGRLGAPHYDPASLLYDAKLQMPTAIRGLLTDYYISRFSLATGTERSHFFIHNTGFSVIRIMQALGAFGYRGLYEGKPGFSDSIGPALIDLESLLLTLKEEGLDLPELYNMAAGNLFHEASMRIEKSMV